MVRITFYGGVGEIGGNKILLEDGDTRIMLDFGMSFEAKRKYYAVPFLSPRTHEPLMEFGLLPKVGGLYEFEEDEPSIDGVLLSHSHMDHSQYVTFLKREIPVYCGETTKTILTCLMETGNRSFEFNFEGVDFRGFRTGDKVSIGGVEVEPVHVDHSVPGAYGFIIHTSCGPVVYTGDFRAHGTRPEMTEDFVSAASRDRPIAMITEATNTTGASPSSEAIVEKTLTHVIRGARGLVLADFAKADVDRLRSFYNASVAAGRKLGISLRQAYLLERLHEDPHLEVPSPDDENILIFKKAKKRYRSWEKEIADRENVADSSEISRLQDKVVLACSLYDMEEITAIKPTGEGCYILSGSEPFNEEMEIDFSKLLNWLNYYGLPQYHIHVSGHVMPLELRDIVEMVNPGTLFPIHTDRPELFAKFCSTLQTKIQAPTVGQAYEVG